MVGLIISKLARVMLVAVLFLILPFSSVYVQGAPTAGFTVNTTMDGMDANPGDGICEMTLGEGDCSLRAAIMEANMQQGADIISLPDGTYNLDNHNTMQGDFTGAELNVSDPLTIIGTSTSGTIINMPESSDVVGWTPDRVMSFIATSGVFDIERLTIQNGNPPLTANGGSHGAGIFIDINAGSLSLNSVVILGNTATGDSQSSGGGIYVNSGTIYLDHSTLMGNSATWRGGGLMLVDGMVSLEDQTLVSENTSQYGGGIFTQGSINLNETTIEGNTAVISGGGIGTQGSLGNILIQNSTIDANQLTEVSGSSGGGISTGLPTELINVTITGNTASDRAAIAGTSSISSITISSSTIVGNTGNTTAALGSSGPIVLKNSLVGGNTPSNCSGANLTSEGYNVEDNHTCGLNLSTDTQNAIVLSKLGPLQDNGGKVWTMALLFGNPALDHGANGTSCPATDARGIIRPNGVSCDAGAFEYVWKIIYLPLIQR